VQTTHQILLSGEYIAESQRMAIAQNRALRFLYQTWWAWWVPRFGMAAFIVFLLVERLQSPAVLMGVFLVLSFVGEVFGRRGLAKARARVRMKGTTTTVSINEEGIDVAGAHGNSHTKWSAMLAPAVYPNGVVLKFNRMATLWLPDSALTGGTPDDVRQLLKENIQAPAANGG